MIYLEETDGRFNDEGDADCRLNEEVASAERFSKEVDDGRFNKEVDAENAADFWEHICMFSKFCQTTGSFFAVEYWFK